MNIIIRIKEHISSRRGYTLLFSVLTAALVMGVAVFIVDIARKQLLLSTTARESMFALYAADSGIECSVWALNNANISTSTVAVEIPCAGSSSTGAWIPASDPVLVASLGFSPSYQTYQTTILPVNFNSNGVCATLVIYDGYDSSGSHKTVVDSRGYNLCETNSSGTLGPASGTQTVERGLRYGIYK